MLRQGTPSREFTDIASMQAHYRALQERLWSPTSLVHKSRDETRPLVDAQRERIKREEAERIRAALDERARTDELVFQVLKPEQLAREPKRIIARTAEAFGLTYDDIVGERRTKDVVRARHAAIAAVREEWPAKTLPQLGRMFGGRDHTTILHALRRMQRDGVPQPPTGMLSA